MKKRIALLVIFTAIVTMTVSCFKKKDTTTEEKKQDTATEQTNTTGPINTDMFNKGNQQLGNMDIKNLTPEEQQFLISNQIDPVKVSDAMVKAEGGDKEALLSLAQLYFNLKDNVKTKKFLQMGVDRNYPEAIYNMAVLLKQEGNEAEANKLIARLPKNAAATSRQLRPGAQAYNNGIDLIKAKKYNEAKAQFISAYNQGIKDADIKIALLNKETKNYNEAIKWFKIAAARGLQGTDFEIGAILYDTGRQSEAKPYLIKAYNSGNKALAMPIAAAYHKENNMNEALKWYKIAARNGDKTAKDTVAQIERGNTKQEAKIITILSDTSKMTSLTDNTLMQLKNSKNQGSESKAAVTKTEEKESAANETKPSYNVNFDRSRTSSGSSAPTASKKGNNVVVNTNTNANAVNTQNKNKATENVNKAPVQADNKISEKQARQQQKEEEKERRRTEKAIADAIRRAQGRKGMKSNVERKASSVAPSGNTDDNKKVEDALNKKAAEYN